MNNLKILKCLFATGLLLECAAAFADADNYGPFTLDAGQIACQGDPAPHIQKLQTYTAPADHFFVADSISVAELSGSGKTHSCAIAATKKRNITATSDFGEVNQEVISEFTVSAVAACGSGAAQDVVETAAVDCSVSAKVQTDAAMFSAINGLLGRLPALSADHPAGTDRAAAP